MMKPVHSATHSALELPLSPADASGFPRRMLEENRIPGFLPLRPAGEALPETLSYDVTGLLSLSDAAAEQKLRAEDLRRLLLYLLQALSRLPVYLLSPDGLVLDADAIYLDPQSRAPCFLYHPGQHADFSDSLSAFLHALLALTDQNEERHMVLAYRLYQESLSHPHSLDYLEHILTAAETTPRAADPAADAAPPLDPLVSEIREVSAEELPQKKSGGLLRRLFHRTEEPNHSAEDAVFLEALREP